MEEFTAVVWRWEAQESGWFFVTLPEDVSDAVDAQVQGLPQAGFGSVKVEVRVGTTTWRTSVFPDAKRGAFVLPLKKSVRAAEGIHEGAVVTVAIEVMPAGGS